MKATLFHSLVTTLLIFGVMSAVSLLPNLSFLDPIELALKDFDLTDIVFSKMNDDRPLRIDTNIVTVNIGRLDRADVAATIRSAAGAGAAVIAVDALFWKHDSTRATQVLAEVARTTPQLILSSRLEYDDQEGQDELSDDITAVRTAIAGTDLAGVRHGYVNFTNDANGFRTIRHWQPATVFQADTLESFALAVIRTYCSFRNTTVPLSVERSLDLQSINYQKQSTGVRIDARDVLRGDIPIGVFSGKIVLMGFLGTTLADSSNYEDSFFSPMNDHYAGKALPDIHGIDIHRNCISMVLSGDMINEPTPYWTLASSILFCLLCTMLFAFVDDYVGHAYDIICKTLQIALLIGLLAASIFVFKLYRWKIDISLAAFALVLSADIFDIYKNAVETARGYLDTRRAARATAQTGVVTVTDTETARIAYTHVDETFRNH